jgi:hypothetical protein
VYLLHFNFHIEFLDNILHLPDPSITVGAFVDMLLHGVVDAQNMHELL